MLSRPFGAALLAASLLVAAAPAGAEPTATDRAAARALFDEGRRLMGKGSFAEACPKLEESQRIDPGIGTKFNLAECQEKIGKVASASENYLEVANAARNAGQTAREQVARARAAALAPKVARLVITVDAAASDVLLKRDGVEVRRPLWGTPAPIDPGDHEVTATAPGKLPFKKAFSVAPGPGTVNVAVPALEAAPPDAVVSTEPGPAKPAPTSWGPRRIAGVAVAGAGVAALGVGSVLGLAAKSKADDSKKDCDPSNPNICHPSGVAARNDARSLGDVATGVFIGGAVLAVGGAVLFFTAPSGAAKTTGLRVGPGSVAVVGTFR